MIFKNKEHKNPRSTAILSKLQLVTIKILTNPSLDEKLNDSYRWHQIYKVLSHQTDGPQLKAISQEESDDNELMISIPIFSQGKRHWKSQLYFGFLG